MTNITNDYFQYVYGNNEDEIRTNSHNNSLNMGLQSSLPTSNNINNNFTNTDVVSKNTEMLKQYEAIKTSSWLTLRMFWVHIIT